MRDLTDLQKSILHILASEDMYGLAVKRELEDYYDEEVNVGRLYPNLDRLVDLGYVDKSSLDKRTNEYKITPAGREVLLDEMEWQLDQYIEDKDKAKEIEEMVENLSEE